MVSSETRLAKMCHPQDCTLDENGGGFRPDNRMSKRLIHTPKVCASHQCTLPDTLFMQVQWTDSIFLPRLGREGDHILGQFLYRDGVVFRRDLNRVHLNAADPSPR